MTETLTVEPFAKAGDYVRAVLPDGETLAAALPTLWAVSEELGLPRLPELGWFERCRPGDRDGNGTLAVGPLGSPRHGFASHATPWLIRVHSGLSAHLTQRVIVHECRHVWQRWQGWDQSDLDPWERDAYAYDEAWMARTGR